MYKYIYIYICIYLGHICICRYIGKYPYKAKVREKWQQALDNDKQKPGTQRRWQETKFIVWEWDRLRNSQTWTVRGWTFTKTEIQIWTILFKAQENVNVTWNHKLWALSYTNPLGWRPPCHSGVILTQSLAYICISARWTVCFVFAMRLRMCKRLLPAEDAYPN